MHATRKKSSFSYTTPKRDERNKHCTPPTKPPHLSRDPKVVPLSPSLPPSISSQSNEKSKCVVHSIPQPKRGLSRASTPTSDCSDDPRFRNPSPDFSPQKPSLPDDQIASAQPTTPFLTLMGEIMDEHDMKLSKKDARLLETLDGADKFLPGDSVKQMECSGLCVNEPSEKIHTDGFPSKTATFSFGRSNRKFLLHAESINTLGLSILSLILCPGPNPTNINVFLNVVQRCRITNNCFVEHIRDLFRSNSEDSVSNPSPRDRLRARANSNNNTEDSANVVVVPLAWLYVLGVKNSFILEHGVFGDMLSKLGFFRQSPQPENNLIENLHLGSPVSDSSSYPSWIGDCLENAGEIFWDGTKRWFLFIERDDKDYRLALTVLARREYDVTALNAEAKVLGNGGGMGKNRALRPEYVNMMNRLLPKLWPTPFISLSHFVTFSKEVFDCALTPRMKLLEKVMRKRNMFPLGKNIGFLEYTTGTACRMPRVQLFDEKDCRIDGRCLAEVHRVFQYKMPLKRNGYQVFLTDRYNGSRHGMFCVVNENEELAVKSHAEPVEELPQDMRPLYMDLI